MGIFKKSLLPVIVLCLALVMPALAFADAGIELRVPYQGLTNASSLAGGASGSGVLLFFGLDAGTTVGLLTEQVNFTDNSVIGTYMVNAIRFSKDVISDRFFFALDIGSGQNAVKQGTLADVAFGWKYLGKKDQITSFINVELVYRLFSPGASMVAKGITTDYGGVFLNLGAGLSF